MRNKTLGNLEGKDSNLILIISALIRAFNIHLVKFTEVSQEKHWVCQFYNWERSQYHVQPVRFKEVTKTKQFAHWAYLLHLLNTHTHTHTQ